MAFSPEQKKKFFLFNLGSGTIAGTCCGLSFVPWTGSGPSGPKTLRYGSWYPRFVFGSVEIENNGIKMPRELFVEASDSLRGKRAGEEIPFKDVTMKWGTKRLEYGDVLVESCTGEGYYVAKHKWNDQFLLETGETVNWSQISNNGQRSSGSGECKLSKKENGKAAKTVKLSVQSTSGGGHFFLSQ